METYVIGDIQGCFLPFNSLLRYIKFDPEKDRLWLVGDIVNRGPDSLNTLRMIKEMEHSVTMVLGNHDLHLISIATGILPRSPKDTFNEILQASDCEVLIDWLRNQKLFHTAGEFAMVHAGLLPNWDIDEASKLAKEAESFLQSDHWFSMGKDLYNNHPNKWQNDLTGIPRLILIFNAMTRMRFCSITGELNFSFKGPPDKIPQGLIPWYQMKREKPLGKTLVFGHWSSLGLHMDAKFIGIDTG